MTILLIRIFYYHIYLFMYFFIFFAVNTLVLTNKTFIIIVNYLFSILLFVINNYINNVQGTVWKLKSSSGCQIFLCLSMHPLVLLHLACIILETDRQLDNSLFLYHIEITSVPVKSHHVSNQTSYRPYFMRIEGVIFARFYMRIHTYM